jgi:hypothetical protein
MTPRVITQASSREDPMDSTPLLTTADRSEPNVELLRRYGYAVGTCHGPYCVAWRGNDEVLVVWSDGDWRRVCDGLRLGVA